MLDGSGKYSRAAQDGRVFSVANQAAVAVTAAYAAIFTGLCVGNPAGSQVMLSLLKFGFGNTILGISVGTIGIMGGAMGAVPITASLTPDNLLLGGPASKAVATAGQTINAAPVPTLLMVCGQTGTAAVNTWEGHTSLVDIDGAIVIPPGYYVATYAFMLAGASLQFSFTWEELQH